VEARHTERLPPGFMPKTATDSAGGGLGPLCPENNPPAVSPAVFSMKPTFLPAVKLNGCICITTGLQGRDLALLTSLTTCA
jgi:hypothetical protein